MTRRSLAISRGVPSAIFSPWWSMTMRWARRIIAAMMCSITIKRQPLGVQAADEVDHPGQLGGVEPGHHLVEQQQAWAGWPARGRPPAACAGPAAAPGPGRRRAGRGRRASITRSASARACRVEARRVSAPIITLSRTERLPNGLTIWKVRVSPSAADRVGGLAGDVAALEDDAPLVGPVVAGDQVEERGLARAVGPDDAEQIARRGPRGVTSRTAVRPPKRLVTRSRLSMTAAGDALTPGPSSSARAGGAVRPASPSGTKRTTRISTTRRRSGRCR